MPRPLIAYEEGSNDHDSLGSRRGQPRPQPAKAEVEEQWFTIKDSLPEHFKDKYNEWAPRSMAVEQFQEKLLASH